MTVSKGSPDLAYPITLVGFGCVKPRFPIVEVMDSRLFKSILNTMSSGSPFIGKER
jgi:hypothetical protein